MAATAARNLAAAADAAVRHPERAAELGVEAREIALWRELAGRVVVPYDSELGVHPQAEGFTRHERWDFAAMGAERYPLMLHYPYFQLYRRQVVKQADLVLALYACGDRFTAEEKARDFAYYEPLTVRDSSLSACVQAIVAVETGHLELAYDYLGEAALMDLEDLEHNTRDGLHIASLAGAWLAVVAGFGGLRDHTGRLELALRLPGRLTRLSFRITFRAARLSVEVAHDTATYTLSTGECVELVHHNVPATVTRGQALTLEVPPAAERPRQPPGREPLQR